MESNKFGKLKKYKQESEFVIVIATIMVRTLTKSTSYKASSYTNYTIRVLTYS